MNKKLKFLKTIAETIRYSKAGLQPQSKAAEVVHSSGRDRQSMEVAEAVHNHHFLKETTIICFSLRS